MDEEADVGSGVGPADADVMQAPLTRGAALSGDRSSAGIGYGLGAKEAPVGPVSPTTRPAGQADAS